MESQSVSYMGQTATLIKDNIGKNCEVCGEHRFTRAINMGTGSHFKSRRGIRYSFSTLSLKTGLHMFCESLL